MKGSGSNLIFTEGNQEHQPKKWKEKNETFGLNALFSYPGILFARMYIFCVGCVCVLCRLRRSLWQKKREKIVFSQDLTFPLPSSCYFHCLLICVLNLFAFHAFTKILLLLHSNKATTPHLFSLCLLLLLLNVWTICSNFLKTRAVCFVTATALLYCCDGFKSVAFYIMLSIYTVH